MGIKVEEGSSNPELISAPDVAQQPGNRLLETQNLLGNMQISPGSWEHPWHTDGRDSAIRLNRINPAEFFPEIEELVTSIGGDELPKKSVLETFKSVWSSGVTMAATSPNENKDWMKHEQRGSQKHKKTLIADLVRRLTRLMVGSRYGKNLEHYEPPQEFRKEVQYRILTASSKTDFLEKTKPILSLVNKALAAQLLASNEKPLSLDDANGTFFGAMRLSPGNIIIEGFPPRNSTGYTLSNISKTIREYENNSPEKNRRLEYYNPWLKDEELKGRISHLENRFAGLNKIAEGRSREMKIVLPKWIDQKEQMGYDFLNSADFMKVALNLFEEQIAFVENYGEKMWQSVQEEEAERTRLMWENEMRPLREKVSILDQEIDDLQKDITATDNRIGSLSPKLENLKTIVKDAKNNLEGKKLGILGTGKGKLLGDIFAVLEDLQKKVGAEIATIEKIEPVAAKKEKVSAIVEPQILRDTEEHYAKEREALKKDLEDKRYKQSEREAQKTTKEQKLQEIHDQIKDIESAAKECLEYYQQISDKQPNGKNITGLLLPNLKRMLSK